MADSEAVCSGLAVVVAGVVAGSGAAGSGADLVDLVDSVDLEAPFFGAVAGGDHAAADELSLDYNMKRMIVVVIVQYVVLCLY